MSLNGGSGLLRVLRCHFSWMDCENNRVIVFALQFRCHVLYFRVSGAGKETMLPADRPKRLHTRSIWFKAHFEAA